MATHRKATSITRPIMTLAAIFTLACSLAAPAAHAAVPVVVKNKDVVDLKAAGFSEDVLLVVASTNTSDFAVTPQDLVALKSSGLSDDVILAIVSASRSASAVQRADPAATNETSDAPTADKECRYGQGVYSHGACLGGQRCYNGEWLPYDRCSTGGGGGGGGGGTTIGDLCQMCGCCYIK